MEEGRMEPEPAPQAEIRAEKLSSQLSAQLSATTRDALGHPLRRQILRTLNESAEPRSPSEIAATTPHVSTSVVSYHAQVLEVCGSVAMSGTRQVRGGVARLYASKVADDEQVAAVLQATRGLDRWAADPR
jgi:DNA-binding transcriptional ArsR family regulator